MLSADGDHPMTKQRHRGGPRSAASQRDEARPAAARHAQDQGGAVDKVLGSLKAKGLIDQQGAPRGDDRPPLCITRAGLEAIGVETEDDARARRRRDTGATSADAGAQATDAVAPATGADAAATPARESPRQSRQRPRRKPAKVAPRKPTPRAGTKQAR